MINDNKLNEIVDKLEYINNNCNLNNPIREVVTDIKNDLVKFANDFESELNTFCSDVVSNLINYNYRPKTKILLALITFNLIQMKNY